MIESQYVPFYVVLKFLLRRFGATLNFSKIQGIKWLYLDSGIM